MSKRYKKWAGGYLDRVSGFYYVKREIAGKAYHFSTRCKTLDGAIEVLRRFERDPGGDLFGVVEESRCSFADGVVRWLRYSAEVKGNGPKHVESQARYYGLWARFLEQRGIVFLDQITAGLVDEYIAWRRSGAATAKPDKPGRAVGPHTIGLEVAAIKVLFSWASRPADQGGFLAVNPLGSYKIPKRPKGSSRVKVFDGGMEWWRKVRAHLSERWQLAGDVLLGSSMRYSSLARLHPDDVDLEKDKITLRGNVIKGKEGVDIYVSHRVAVAARRVSMMGLPSESVAMNHALEAAALKAGERYASVHTFRHQSASMASEAGLSVMEIQYRLAHASPRTTEIYLHRLGHSKIGYRGPI